MTAGVPFDAPAVERGVGFFETLLVIGERVSLWGAHVARLRGTLARFALPAPDERELGDAARAVLRGGADERALRLTWIAVGRDLGARASWRLDASARPIPSATLRRRGGCRAVTLPRDLRRDLPEAKSTSYLAAALGARWAAERGADDGLFVDDDGRYLEATTCGLVAWRGGALAWPERGVLPSVTTAAFAERRGERRAPSRADLLGGAIVAGALTRAAPLASLDGEPCARPPEMLARIAAFNAALDAEATTLDESRSPAPK